MECVKGKFLVDSNGHSYFSSTGEERKQNEGNDVAEDIVTAWEI